MRPSGEYSLPWYRNIPAGMALRFKVDQDWQEHRVSTIIDFLKYIVNKDRLQIAEYFHLMEQAPFFLVASTGLGKTVGVPPHILLRQCEDILKPNDNRTVTSIPRVWVVEPRIPIAIEQMEFMNKLYRDYLNRNGELEVTEKPILFGCVTSASGRINPNAPVMFVTTGILALLAKGDQLIANRDRIIIDEAHVTVEQNPDVELAIAIARRQGVVVDYMSATVDTRNLRETLGVEVVIDAVQQRHPIWAHNLGKTVEESIVDLIQNTLVDPNPDSEYFPGNDYRDRNRVLNDVIGGDNRARGMLVIVNSFSGENSDISQLARLVEEAPFNQNGTTVEVLKLASEVIRNKERFRAFQHHMETIDRKAGRYVIFATSVVEMGVTFPTLDFVVTMDSGYENMTIGESMMPKLVPLGVNALKQRFGRVGRRRSGIAYIGKEIGAYYSDLDDPELNGRGLVYEQIGLPLLNSSLTQLAMYSFEQEWQDVESELEDLALPSKIHRLPSRVEELQTQRQRLINLGIADGNNLTPLGEVCDKWVGMADLGYAVKLQEELAAEYPELERVNFWIVATALSATSAGNLLERQGKFAPDSDEIVGQLPTPKVIYNTKNELVSLYQIVAYFARRFGHALWSNPLMIEREKAEDAFDSVCQEMGLDPKKLSEAIKAVGAALKTTCDINNRQEGFISLFGKRRSLEISDVDWVELSDESVEVLSEQLSTLPGRHQIRFEEGRFGLTWIDDTENRQGNFSQDDTPVTVILDSVCTGKLVPQLIQEEESGLAVRWKPIHILHS